MEKQYGPEKVFYRKLIRDHYPEIMTKKGVQFETVVMEEDEFFVELTRKIGEEAEELKLATDHEERVKELADLLNTLEDYIAAYQLSKEEVVHAQQAMREKKGGFTKRLKLLWSQDSQ